MCWMSFSSNALLLKRARNMKPRESQVAKCAMSASTRVHAALEQWILRAEATASDSEDETIPGLPWTSNWAGASSHLLDDSGSITSTQVDTEVFPAKKIHIRSQLLRQFTGQTSGRERSMMSLRHPCLGGQLIGLRN